MMSATRGKPVVIAQFSDLHVTGAGLRNEYGIDAAAGLVRCIEHVRRLDAVPDLVVASGDLVDAGESGEYARLRELLARLPAPLCLMPGNHDRRAPLREIFSDHEYLGGGGRIHYHRDVRGLRLIMLDSVIEGSEGGDLDEVQLQWLDGLLRGAPEQPVLVFMHHPPAPTGFLRMDRIAVAPAGAERLGQIIAGHAQVRAVLCGHVHRSVQVAWHGAPVSICPSTAFQARLRLGPGEFEASPDEPPAYQLHRWDGRSLATHTISV